MDSKEISRFIGKNVLKRKLGYVLIYLTTLREWYIRQGITNLLEYLRAPLNVLDAGSGLGQHSYFIAKKYPGTDVTALELDEEQVLYCNEFVKKTGLKDVQFLQGDLVNYRSENPFDVVICCSVLEHIQDDTSVLERFHGLIKQKGYILIYVPTSEKRILASVDKKIYSMVRKAGQRYPHGHVRYYAPEELKLKLTNAGFDVIQSAITYGPMGRLAYDLVTAVQYSSFFKIIFPFYFLFMHPVVMLLMWMDVLRANSEGNGLIVLARKR